MKNKLPHQWQPGRGRACGGGGAKTRLKDSEDRTAGCCARSSYLPVYRRRVVQGTCGTVPQGPYFSFKNPIILPRRFEWSREYGRAELILVTSPSILSFQKNELLQQSRAGILGRLTSLDFPAFRKALIIYLLLESRPTKDICVGKRATHKKYKKKITCITASVPRA